MYWSSEYCGDHTPLVIAEYGSFGLCFLWTLSSLVCETNAHLNLTSPTAFMSYYCPCLPVMFPGYVSPWYSSTYLLFDVCSIFPLVTNTANASICSNVLHETAPVSKPHISIVPCSLAALCSPRQRCCETTHLRSCRRSVACVCRIASVWSEIWRYITDESCDTASFSLLFVFFVVVVLLLVYHIRCCG